MKKYLQLNDISCYKRSFYLSNYVWNIVIHWDNFTKQTIGIQYCKSIDSISANIAEGFGRYTKKDKTRFFHISYGSITESLDWNEKSHVRKLLSEKQYKYILNELQNLPKEVHQLISFTNEKLKK